MTWFEQVFGVPEGLYADMQEQLRVDGDCLLVDSLPPRSFQLGILTTPSLGELRDQVRQLSLTLLSSADVSACTAEGLTLQNLVADAYDLHTWPEVCGAMIQVASQFNLLEMPNPLVSPEDGITAYQHDRTQGPACAMACAPATLFRNYLVPINGQKGQNSHHQINTLSELSMAIGIPGICMQNGYAMVPAPVVQTIGQHMQRLDESSRDALRQTLRIGIQSHTQVTAQGASSGQMVSQAFCSALPIAYNSAPASDWMPFSTLVLEATYEATLLAAVLNWHQTGNRRVYLTMVGGGVFGNDRVWIIQAMRRALNVVHAFPLQVYVVSYMAIPADLAALAAEINSESLYCV